MISTGEWVSGVAFNKYTGENEVCVSCGKYVGGKYDGAFKIVAFCGVAGAEDEEESWDNANLISAAPEMLQIIAAIDTSNGANDIGADLCERIEKVLAKVKGEI